MLLLFSLSLALHFLSPPCDIDVTASSHIYPLSLVQFGKHELRVTMIIANLLYDLNEMELKT